MLSGMCCVSVNLTSSEWLRIQQAAQKAFPGETLSRGEVVRRYTLAGIQVQRVELVAAAIAQFSCRQRAGCWHLIDILHGRLTGGTTPFIRRYLTICP